MYNKFVITVFLLLPLWSSGESHVPRTLHIIGGILARLREIPYQVSLWNGTQHFCGGALLSDEWVITAAHCLGKMGPYKVRIKSLRSDSGGKLLDVIADYKHPYFNEIYSYDYDVALIRVKKFNSLGMLFAKWPQCGTEKCIRKTGNMINISGWGRNVFASPEESVQLQKVRLPVIDFKMCKKIYKYSTEITHRMFCCGYLEEVGKDSCQGDSGGPATCHGYLVGLVSAGTEDCGIPGRPGLYTDLLNRKIQKWITKKTGGHGRYCPMEKDKPKDKGRGKTTTTPSPFIWEDEPRVWEEPPALQPLMNFHSAFNNKFFDY